MLVASAVGAERRANRRCSWQISARVSPLSDRAHLLFGDISVQRIGELHVNPAIPQPRGRGVELARVEIIEDPLDIEAGANGYAHTTLTPRLGGLRQ
jgi:hypothetical protein